jgi:hypothetical protein
MPIRRILIPLVSIIAIVVLVLTACTGPAGSVGPVGPAGPAGPKGDTGPLPSAADLTCTACHNDTTLLTGKETQWSMSVHGTGTNFLRGTSASCAGCHSGGGFNTMILAGLTPDKVTDGDQNPTRQDCRACHQIHTTYTFDDFALETTAPVAMFATITTFNGGEGNLCANCHQARAVIPAVAEDGTITLTSVHMGPMAPQSDMVVGVGGAGEVIGSPSPHYAAVENTCVTCHMGSSKNHTFEPVVATCVTCHTDATDFDMNGAVTALEAKVTDLKAALTLNGLLDAQGAIIVGKFPEAQVNALWNYIFIEEDGSNGVHNMPYAEALIDASLASFGK